MSEIDVGSLTKLVGLVLTADEEVGCVGAKFSPNEGNSDTLR
jgi:putative aminopeptidase FrvX